MRITLQYFPGVSVMHRMDPASKFVWVAIVGALSFVLTSPVLIVGVMALLLLTWLGLVNITPQRAARSTLWILILAGGAFFFQLVARRTGEPVVFLGPLAITDDGVRGGFRFAARIGLLAFSTLAFVWTPDPQLHRRVRLVEVRPAVRRGLARPGGGPGLPQHHLGRGAHAPCRSQSKRWTPSSSRGVSGCGWGSVNGQRWSSSTS